MKEALFYKKMQNRKVQCTLCPNNCIIAEGATGICKVRKNDKGKLFSLNYGMVSSLALDPIEKKPLDFFMPGTQILSAGTYGCNFKCQFCQNWSISQQKPELEYIDPEKLCEIAGNIKGNIGIAFTYNEPLIWYEYVYETCKINKSLGMANVLVTNGYINPKPLKQLLPFIDAMNIDLKSFKNTYYTDVCSGQLEPVKQTIIECAKNCHVEITNLSVPGLNDSHEEMDAMCKWIESIDNEIPLHIIPFRPLYKMKDLPPQTSDNLLSLRQTALKHLKNVVI
ncbi:MAG: AmmeMemoRadiSam system radical SAM enzyme [Clostridiales bacterium]|nr:AmmeMemoRadiSam system radical SAM enzyme [Clostridiales bacterium]